MTKEQVKACCAYKGITLSSVANNIGMSKQSLSNKLTRGTLNDEELTAIAKAIGAKYISCFEFPDGTRI